MRPVYTKTQDTRLAGAERRLRFLERREQLPNPKTIDDLGGGSSPYAIYQAFGVTIAAADPVCELPFDPGDCFFSDDTVFDVSGGGRAQILEPGGYSTFASVTLDNFTGETGAVAEIFQVVLVTGIHTDYGVTNSHPPPVQAWVSQTLLPGGGAVVPMMQSQNFFSVDQGWPTAGLGTPVVYPVEVKFELDWTCGNDHDVDYSLTVMKFG